MHTVCTCARKQWLLRVALRKNLKRESVSCLLTCYSRSFEGHAKLADEYGIGTSTVGDIKKDEAKIRSFASIICQCLDYFTCTWYMCIHLMIHVSGRFTYLGTVRSHRSRITEAPLYMYMYIPACIYHDLTYLSPLI